MIRNTLVLFVLALSLSACTTVSHVPLSQEASTKLQGKRVASTQYATADFTAMTAGKAAFAVVGAAAMISAGNAIVRENGIADPAIAISQGLSDRLAARRGVNLVQGQRAVAAKDDVAVLVSTYPGADYLLDVKTFNWMFGYYPTDWSHYRVMYSARLRLIDTASQNVVAETMCQSVQGDDANPPTKDQLLENKAALLKEYLSKATAACVDVLARDVLML